MSLAEKIKAAAEAGNLDSVLSEVTSLEEKTTRLTQEIQTLDSTKKELIESRDKYKSKYQLSKQKLGFQENEEFNEENLDKKLSGLTKKTDETLKNELKSMEDILKAKDSEYKELLSKKDSELHNYKLDTELSKYTSKLRGVNSRADELLMSEFKKGATFEDNKIVFKGEDGQIVRDSDGLPLSVEKRISTIRESEDFKPFISAQNIQSGSGQKTAEGGATTQKGGLRERLEAKKASSMI